VSAAVAAARIATAILDAVLPPTCLCCDAPVGAQGTLCPVCFNELQLIVAPLCDRCGAPFAHRPTRGEGRGDDRAPMPCCEACTARPPPWSRARAALLYGEGARRLILPFKHGDRPELAGPLSRYLLRAGAEILRDARAQGGVLVPVPLHWRRQFGRRYNQSGLLAQRLSRASGVAWSPDLLLRRRATAPLGGKGAAERAASLHGAFRVPAGAAARLAGRPVVLVDDVLTSGATAGACTRVLLAAGALRVDVLAMARVARREEAGREGARDADG